MAPARIDHELRDDSPCPSTIFQHTVVHGPHQPLFPSAGNTGDLMLRQTLSQLPGRIEVTPFDIRAGGTIDHYLPDSFSRLTLFHTFSIGKCWADAPIIDQTLS